MVVGRHERFQSTLENIVFDPINRWKSNCKENDITFLWFIIYTVINNNQSARSIYCYSDTVRRGSLALRPVQNTHQNECTLLLLLWYIIRHVRLCLWLSQFIRPPSSCDSEGPPTSSIIDGQNSKKQNERKGKKKLYGHVSPYHYLIITLSRFVYHMFWFEFMPSTFGKLNVARKNNDTIIFSIFRLWISDHSSCLKEMSIWWARKCFLRRNHTKSHTNTSRQ